MIVAALLACAARGLVSSTVYLGVQMPSGVPGARLRATIPQAKYVLATYGDKLVISNYPD